MVDDSFATIVDGVEEGRRITANIKKVILYLLAGNIVEVILVFMSLLLNMEMFTTIQLLWINLITDSIPAIMLAFEKSEDEVKNIKGYNSSSFLTPFIKAKLSIGAIIKSIIMLSLFLFFNKQLGNAAAGSLMFIFLITHELLFAFSCKNPKKCILNKKIFDNKKLNIGMFSLLIIQLIITLTPISKFFIVNNLALKDVIMSIGVCFILFVFGELLKPLYASNFKDYVEVKDETK
jgi:Ca2+-transporting ATPase